MSKVTTLQEIDRDAALQETMEAVAGDSRAGFLRKAALAGGGLVGGGAVLGALATNARAATPGDIAILNFALTLEYLEAEFYKEAVGSGALSGDLASFAGEVARHEAAHVAALKQVLGSNAVAKPRFNFRGTTESAKLFGKTAMALEDTGVAAYKGQAGNIQDTAVLKAALAIHTVEARHASWIRHLLGAAPAPAAFDQPKSKEQILAIVASTRFLAGAPSMSSNSSPSFTG